MRIKDLDRARIVNMDYPCALPEEYEVWKRAARLSRPPYDSWFCVDCTPDFQKLNKKLNRCARPDIRFKRMKDGSIEGFMPPKHVIYREFEIVDMTDKDE